jgi:hypothetical protein
MFLFLVSEKNILKKITSFIEDNNSGYNNFLKFISKKYFNTDIKLKEFKNIVKKYNIDLSKNNNFLIKKIINLKKYEFLDFFWQDEKIKNDLLLNDKKLYDFISIKYDLTEAINNNDIKKIEYIISLDFNKTILNELYYKNSHLFLAIHNKNTNIVKILINDRKFDINYINNYSSRWAFRLNDINTFKVLFNNKKNVLNEESSLYFLVLIYNSNYDNKLEFIHTLLYNKYFYNYIHSLKENNLYYSFTRKILIKLYSKKIESF